MRAFAWIGTGLLLAAASPPPVIADLKPIALHPGINRIAGFLPGGATATIVEAWRGNGNAHGYHVWMVLGGPSEGSPIGLVGVDGAGRPSDVITDNPFDGERALGAVRFATGMIAGRQATLLVEAKLDDSPSGIPADHATATVRWFRLDHQADATGRTTDAFVPIGTAQTTKRYCNADLALRDVAHIPLTAQFGGANSVDGCFHDAK